MEQIIWNPIISELQRLINETQEIVLVICPFIQLNALQKLLDQIDDVTKLKIITRWNKDDIASDVSDINIYPYLHERQVQLFIHDSIHIKLYVFHGNNAFITSGNCTMKGLGISDACNIEAGVSAELSDDDIVKIDTIINQSIEVTDEIYKIYSKYKAEHTHQKQDLPDIELPKIKDFSFLTLPSITSPDALYQYYTSQTFTTYDEQKRYEQDIHQYSIGPGLSKDDFLDTIKKNFLNHNLIKMFIEDLKSFQNKYGNEMKYGEVTSWIQDHCSDKPVPYRAPVKDKVYALYRWLGAFMPQIKVRWRHEQPGGSDRIYWEE
jgi:hypothetical protein